MKKLIDLELKLAVHLADHSAEEKQTIKKYKLPLAVLLLAFLPLLFAVTFRG